MKFLRRNSEFFDLIQDIYGELEKITALFREFGEGFPNPEETALRAKEIEHAGDAKTHAVIDTLNKLFVTPFDREDIYLLVQQLDDVIDMIENVIKNIYLYGIREEFPAFRQFADLTGRATAELGEMLQCLGEMKYTPRFVALKISIHDLEDQGDEIFDASIRTLFQEEKDLLKVIKTKDVLEGLEEIMDKYQSISNIVEGILVKSN